MSAPTSAYRLRGQYGVEATAGVPVAASTRPSSVSLTMKPEASSSSIRPSGEEFHSLVYLTDERSSGSLEGVPTFGEMADILALTLGAPTTAAIDDEPGGYEHNFTLQGTRPTWTVEVGSPDQSGTGERYSNVFAKGLEMSFEGNSGESQVSCELVGGPVTDGITITNTPAPEKARPATAASVTVYCDDTLDGIGETRLDRTAKVTVKLDSLGDLVKYLGGQMDQIRTAPEATIELAIPVNSTAYEFLAGMRSSKTRYIRIEAVGATIPGTSVKEAIQIDAAVQVETPDRGEEDAVYLATTTFRVVTDRSGFSLAARVVSDES